jgi:hypothetical protein
VRQPPDHGVARRTTATATPTPVIWFGDPARQHRPIRLEALPHDFETELIQAAKRSQVRASEGSVEQVGVFVMGSVRTPIMEDPDLDARIPTRQALHPHL